jgi:hypothetical protein
VRSGAQRGRIGGAPKPATFASDPPGYIPRSPDALRPKGALDIAGTLKSALFRPALCGCARVPASCAAAARPARSRAEKLSFPSVPEWARADRALGLAAIFSPFPVALMVGRLA